MNAAQPLPRIGEGVFFQLSPIAGDTDAENAREDGAPSLGISSSTSSPSTATSTSSGAAKLRKPARTTANR